MGAAPILTILKNGQELRTQPVEGEIVLGRAEGCVIRLDDRAVSREHAVFRPVSGGVQVERKSEVAPLSVNGTECTRALVKEGDVISIGPYLLKLSMGAATVGLAPQVPAPQAATSTDLEVASEVEDVSLPDFEAPLSESSLQLAPPSTEVQLTSSLQLDSPAEAFPAAGTESVLKLELGSPSSASEGTGLQLEAPPEVQEIASHGKSDSSVVEIPVFSLGGAAAKNSGPIDVGEFAFDEEAKTKVFSATKLSAKLLLPPGVANVTELEIDKDEISIGRGKDCDVVLDDKKASRKHAIIRRSGTNFSIKDLDSANGTYVNDSKISEQELSGDDILRIGNVEFRFLALSADYAAKQERFMPVPEEPAPDFTGFADRSQVPGPMPQIQGVPIFQAGATAHPGLGQVPGLGAVPGIAGLTPKKTSLFEKYRALPPRRKAIWTVVIIGAVFFLLFDDEPKKAAPKKPAGVVKNEKATMTFENLTPEQKKFVEAQHALAFDYYKNRDYDKALFEVQKIFTLIPDYKDSREIERYSKEGKRKLEALEEEKRKKEEEEKLKLKIADLVNQTKTDMDEKKYPQARELFSQILALDPDNLQVSEWRRILDQFDEDQRIQEQQKAVQQQINVRAWDLYKEGLALKTDKKLHDAIDTFKKVLEVGATDKRVEKVAKIQIKDTEALISQLRDPVLADAKTAEDSQDYTKAFGLYKQATEIDPPHPAGYAGMGRIRGILHERAKVLYIDAVLAESYSDFETAKKKYMECREVSPKDDIYHERAERKLASFFKAKEEQPQ